MTKPLIVLFDQEGTGESERGGVVGEDADDVGSAADLAVDTLERVGASELGPVRVGPRPDGTQKKHPAERSRNPLIHAVSRDRT